MHRYVTDPVTSLWQTETYQGVTIGAQAYRGGVLNAQGDAMKNSDHGAMWMLAQLSGDPALVRDRLPFARNFKLQQQERTPGFFGGAAAGQYYLAKSQRFTEEWGDYVEPVALTSDGRDRARARRENAPAFRGPARCRRKPKSRRRRESPRVFRRPPSAAGE